MLSSNIVRNKTIFVNLMAKSDPAIFKIYTDGGCLNNGKKNAICSIGIHFPERNLYPILDVSKVLDVEKASNNVAELTAIKEALEIYSNEDIKIPLNIYSDSKYSMNILTKWYPKWTDKDKQSKKNIPLIENTYELYNEIKPNISHVRSHTNLDDEHSLGNAIADQFANDALDKFENNNIGILKYFQQ